MSCLQAIEGEDTENPLICHIMNLLWALSDKGTRVRFCWVPNHCGIEGNEIVDQLAYTGHHLRVPEPPVNRTSLGSRRNSYIKDIIWGSPGLQYTGHYLSPWISRASYTQDITWESPGLQSTGDHLGVPGPPIHNIIWGPGPPIHRTSLESPRASHTQDITWESLGLQYTGHHFGVPGLHMVSQHTRPRRQMPNLDFA